MSDRHGQILKFGNSEKEKWIFEFNPRSGMWDIFGVGGQPCCGGYAGSSGEALTLARMKAEEFLSAGKIKSAVPFDLTKD